METGINAQHSIAGSHRNTITSAWEFDDIVTIVRDPRNPFGKSFHTDGSKSAEVRVSLGVEVQWAVPTAEVMAAVLKEISEGLHAAFPAAVRTEKNYD